MDNQYEIYGRMTYACIPETCILARLWHALVVLFCFKIFPKLCYNDQIWFVFFAIPF